MEQTPQQTTMIRRGGPAGLVLCLTVLSILAACGGAVAFLAALVPPAVAGNLTGWIALTSLAYLVGGLSAGCALWALSWVVRCQFESALAQRRAVSILTGTEALPALPLPAVPLRAVAPPSPPSAPSREAPARNEELLSAVRELSANLLLTPEERQVKRLRQQDEIGNQLVRQARDAIAMKDLPKAEDLLARIASEYPAEVRAKDLSESLEQARAAAAEEEIGRAQTRVRDLMALSQFDDARDVARGLQARHPHDPRSGALLESVTREAGAFSAQYRRRLYKELDRQVTDRHWKAAFATAKQFLEKYPDSSEAKLVAAQIQTLEDNARIEEVRDLRGRLRDCLERKRYADALEVAREVMRRFPDSAAAAELAGQIPRLEELAGEKEG